LLEGAENERDENMNVARGNEQRKKKMKLSPKQIATWWKLQGVTQ